MPLLIISVFLMVIAAWGNQTVNLFLNSSAQNQVVLSSGQALIASEVQRYHLQTGAWPTSLAALSTAAGFQHLKQYVPRANGGAFTGPTSPWSVSVSNTLNDGTYQFQRTAAVAIADNTVSLSTYFSSANNTCNLGSSTLDFYSTASWCGSSTWGYWSKTDTLEWRTKREGWSYAHQNATAAKLQRAYLTTLSFPAVATAKTLASLATPMYAGATVGVDVTSCLGEFYWQGIGLECSDLYNQFGNPVSYVRTTTKQFVLSSASQILTAAGTTRALSTTVTMP